MLTVCLLSLYGDVQAQATASAETLTGIGIAGNYTTISESVFIGPGTYVLNGTWDIYAKNVWISPDAIISGTGSIRFNNPADAGGTSGATLIDGNNSIHAIDVNIFQNNDAGAGLTQIVKDGTLTGWADSTAGASLYVGKDLNLAVAGANVALGTGVAGNLIFDADATISGYAADRFVITNNSAANHMVKETYSGPFVFPVGIAAGEYSPATVNNVIANSFHVSVQDYDQSASAERNTQDGVNRTWNIYAANATGNSVLTLQHDFSSEQPQFNRSNNFITQYGPVAPNTTGDGITNSSYSYWQSNQLAVPVINGTTSSLSRAYTSFGTSAADPLSFFSKSSNVAQPLPLELISFAGDIKDCQVSLSWETGKEDNVDVFDVQYSADGNRFANIGTVKAAHKPAGNKYGLNHTLTSPKGYYRLAIPLANGYKYSHTVLLNGSNCSARMVKLSPNPTTGLLLAEGLQAGDMIRVYSLTGQELYVTRATGSMVRIDMRAYPAAAYQVSVSNGDQLMFSARVVKAE